jgi:hypothetical protein
MYEMIGKLAVTIGIMFCIIVVLIFVVALMEIVKALMWSLNEKLRTWIAIILSLILIGIWFLLIYYGL